MHDGPGRWNDRDMEPGPVPLNLGAVFADRWEGEGRLWRPWWWRWLPLSERFRFASERLNVRDDSWDVLDTLTFPNGRVQRRTMHAEQLTAHRIRLTADDMPDGAVLRSGPDGFEFAPYVIRTPVLGPIRLPLHHYDVVRLEDGDTMIDTIELRLLGVLVARVTMRLKRRRS